jgi:hypothetical protein
MRKYWVITLVVAYLLCQDLNNLVRWFGDAPAPPVPTAIGVDLIALLLFFVLAAGVRWMFVVKRRVLGIVMAVLGLAGQGGYVYASFAFADSATYLATMRPYNDPRLARIPEAAIRSNRGHPGRSGRMAARMYFDLTGVRIPYRDESDEVRMFEPTAKNLTAYEGMRDADAQLEKARPMLRTTATRYRWWGYSNVALATAAILTGFLLSRQQRQGRPARTE